MSIKIQSVPEAVFKRFDGFTVMSVQRHFGGSQDDMVKVGLNRNDIDIVVYGPFAAIENLICLHKEKYWDGGKDPVIGQEFRSKSRDKAYTVTFPYYRDGVLVGCYANNEEVKEASPIFVRIADMLPGIAPLSESQVKAIGDVVEMCNSGWITREQKDSIIESIKDSTKS